MHPGLACSLALAIVLSAPTRAASFAGEASPSLCFSRVAERSGIAESMLRAVAQVESNFRADAVHINTDGTRDVGVMQINSRHFPELQRRYHLTERNLIESPCINIAVGARILADHLQHYQGTWRGVGSYGAGMASRKEHARYDYATLVARALADARHPNQVATPIHAARRMVVTE